MIRQAEETLSGEIVRSAVSVLAFAHGGFSAETEEIRDVYTEMSWYAATQRRVCWFTTRESSECYAREFQKTVMVATLSPGT